MNVTNDANSDGTSPNDSSKVVNLSRQFQKKKNKETKLRFSQRVVTVLYKISRRRNN